MTRYGLFAFQAGTYAVELSQLRKVVHKQPGYLLPCLPETVAEVLVEGGQLIPLLELPGLTAADRPLVRGAAYKVLAESEGGLVAFPAAATLGIVTGSKGTLEDSRAPGMAGVLTYKKQDYHILDIDLLALGLAQDVQPTGMIDGAGRH